MDPNQGSLHHLGKKLEMGTSYTELSCQSELITEEQDFMVFVFLSDWLQHVADKVDMVI